MVELILDPELFSLDIIGIVSAESQKHFGPILFLFLSLSSYPTTQQIILLYGSLKKIIFQFIILIIIN